MPRFVISYANGDAIAVATTSGGKDLCSNGCARSQLLCTFSNQSAHDGKLSAASQ